MNPTDEQINALNLFRTGDSLAIEAGAGTGKTTTLQLLADDTRKRGQYVAFNKAIVVEAGAKFPAHVATNTAHSLAMRAVGKNFRHRLNTPRMKPWVLAEMIGVKDQQVKTFEGDTRRLSAGYLAGLTLRAVGRFCQTADPEPTRYHVPYVKGLDEPGKYDGNAMLAQYIAPFARKAWEDLRSPAGRLPFGHDHYLKIWQLSNPTIYADFILFDEAQDANPVMAAVIEAQAHAQLVWVGDSQQQIYSFTGAVNALSKVDAEHRAFLTQSFRFGPAIADVANMALTALDAELRLRGLDSIPSRIDLLDDPRTILTRTNATAVMAVLNAIQRDVSVHLVGGGKEIASFARAAEKLIAGQRTEHPELACFDNWGEVQHYVEHDEQGGDLRLMVRLVDTFGVETILRALDGTTPETKAQLIVSTAHKAKGREWDTVQLGDDFPEDASGEELRLLYVAATRAKLVLDLDATPFFAGVGA